MNQDNNQQNLNDIDQVIGAALEDLSAPEEASPIDPTSQADAEKVAVMAAINRLPERYLICLLLHFYENLSFGEIAEVMEVNENVVVEMLGKAKKLIREDLEKDGVELKELGAKQGSTAIPSSTISQAFAFAEADTLSPHAEEQLGHTAADVKLERRSLWSYLTESKMFKVTLAVAVVAVLCAAGLLAYRQFAHFFPWNIASSGGTPVADQPLNPGSNGSTDSKGAGSQPSNGSGSNSSGSAGSGSNSADPGGSGTSGPGSSGSGSSANGSGTNGSGASGSAADGSGASSGDGGVSVTVTPSDDAETIVIVKGQDIEEYKAFEAEKPSLTFISEDVSEGYRYTIYSKQTDTGTPQYYVIIEKVSS